KQDLGFRFADWHSNSARIHPESREVVKISGTFGEDVHNDVEEVEQDPLAFSLNTQVMVTSLRKHLVHIVGERNTMSIARSCHHDKEVRVVDLPGNVDDFHTKGLLTESCFCG